MCIRDRPTQVYIAPVPDAPQVVNDGPGCEGTTVNAIVPQPIPGMTYSWYDAATDVLVGTGDSLILSNIDITQAGEYYLIVTSPNGCESAPSLPTEIVVNPSPSQSAFAGEDNGVCGMNVYTLEAIEPIIGTGQWTSLGAAIVSNTSQHNLSLIHI